MRKLKALFLILLVSAISLACSGPVFITFYGKIFNYRPADSASYEFVFHEFGKAVYKYTPSFDSTGNYIMKLEFSSIAPQCVSLLKNGKMVDRYYLKEEHNDYKGLVNVFTGNMVATPEKFSWGAHYEIKKLDFNDKNYLKDTNALKFDSLQITVNHIPERRVFEFKLDDVSQSSYLVTAYYKRSELDKNAIKFDGVTITIPEDELGKGDSDYENTIIFRVFSKHGWYRDISKVIW